jgi:hypothetical protein
MPLQKVIAALSVTRSANVTVLEKSMCDDGVTTDSEKMHFTIIKGKRVICKGHHKLEPYNDGNEEAVELVLASTDRSQSSDNQDGGMIESKNAFEMDLSDQAGSSASVFVRATMGRSMSDYWSGNVFFVQRSAQPHYGESRAQGCLSEVTGRRNIVSDAAPG